MKACCDTWLDSLKPVVAAFMEVQSDLPHKAENTAALLIRLHDDA